MELCRREEASGYQTAMGDCKYLLDDPAYRSKPGNFEPEPTHQSVEKFTE